MNNDITAWAQALLEFPNLCFVVIDTTSIKRDADILRVIVMGYSGMRYDYLVRPQRYNDPNTLYTGLTQEEIDGARPLTEMWDAITLALRGQFVLAYGFDFVQERLDENAKHYGLEDFCIIGDCLMQKSVQYFRSTNYGMKLTDACKRIGHALPDRPNAEQRAQGQLALLRAMSQGITSAPTPSSDEDAHPF